MFFPSNFTSCFQKHSKILNAYLAIMCTKQQSTPFRISHYHSSLTLLETVQILHVKYMLACHKHLCQLHSRPQIKAASSKERAGQPEARGVKVMCPLWQVEDGKTQGPQLHPVPSCRGEGSGWTDRQTDTYRKIQPTKTVEGV